MNRPPVSPPGSASRAVHSDEPSATLNGPDPGWDVGMETATNEVRLCGRLSGVPDARVLPSGDTVVLLRVVVDRPPASDGRRRVDTIDVACWSARTRRTATRLPEGQVVEVEGSLRRRFFRSGGTAASRYEVEARSVRRVRLREVDGGNPKT